MQRFPCQSMSAEPDLSVSASAYHQEVQTKNTACLLVLIHLYPLLFVPVQ